MKDNFPRKVRIKSDGNELDFVDYIKDAKKEFVRYRYSKSITKVNKEVDFLVGEFWRLMECMFEEVKENE